MVQQNGMKVATLLALFTLSGCSSIRDVEYIDPKGYSDVASYLSETFEKSNCIGTTFVSRAEIHKFRWLKLSIGREKPTLLCSLN